MNLERTIITGLLELVAQGNFNVSSNGAKQISGLVDAAEQYIATPEAEVPDAEEIESDE